TPESSSTIVSSPISTCSTIMSDRDYDDDGDPGGIGGIDGMSSSAPIVF
ncbi:12508_t:CDS:1, partial [Funneliformis mosseae]